MIKKLAITGRLALLPLIALTLMVGPAIMADSGANHQVRNQNFGVSGGNINDRSRAFCCSGTLGSLVVDSTGVQHILSNNHVLARTNSASLGEDISQPGLIDVGCNVNNTTIVGDLSAFPPVGTSNVDAAIAALRSGTMKGTGEIEDIGTISSVVRSPTVGLAVQKSGRTTGHTTASIGAINANVSVQYQQGCGQGRRFTVSYTGQIVVSSSTFSAGGDSGSLVVTNDTCNQPVGLLFAGSSTTTILNPIGEVLTKVGTALGRTVSFVGDTCSTSSLMADVGGISTAELQRVTRLKDRRANRWLARPGVIGVGVGAAEDNPNEAAIVVFIDRTSFEVPQVPNRVNGARVRKVYTDPIIAY